MNSTATCCASHALPPFPITHNRRPRRNRSAIFWLNSPICSALRSKNLLLTSIDSWHLRMTLSCHSCAEIAGTLNGELRLIALIQPVHLSVPDVDRRRNRRRRHLPQKPWLLPKASAVCTACQMPDNRAAS